MPLRAMPVPAPEPCRDHAAGRPGEGSAERPDRQGHADRAAAAAELRDGGLQALLRRLELAGQLRVEVAPRVDGFHEGGPRGHDPLDARPRGQCPLLERRRLARVRLQLLPFPRDRLERAAVLLHAVAIDPRQRRGRAVRPPDRPHVLHIQKQPPVAGASHLVQLDQPGLDVRALDVGTRAQFRRPGDGGVERRARRPEVGLDADELLRLHLPVDLQRAELDEQRLLLRGERVRFAAEGAQPFVGAPRRGVHTGALLRRGGRRLRRERQDERQREAKRSTSHR